MGLRRGLRVWLALLWFGVGTAAWGKGAQAPTLQEVLARLQQNLDHYDQKLPSLFCEERAVSKVEPDAKGHDTVTDSMFRVKREGGPGHTTVLAESRDVRSVNGVPAGAQALKGPSLLSGVFEGGLAVVSEDQKGCMRYALEASGTKRARPYVVRFATEPDPRDGANCLLQEKSQGRAWIDPATMQITRLELTTPRHTIIPRDGYEPAVVGKREIRVQYAPVVLGDETFWLPAEIQSRSTDSRSFRGTTWTFEATYRNCHKTEVRSRILPGGEQ